jgi:hypothetical protein
MLMLHFALLGAINPNLTVGPRLINTDGVLAFHLAIYDEVTTELVAYEGEPIEISATNLDDIYAMVDFLDEAADLPIYVAGVPEETDFA